MAYDFDADTVMERQHDSAPLRTVAIAGGAGFLGSHLCTVLRARGERVVCIDNFHTGRSANIASLGRDPGFLLLEHDIREPLPAGLPRFDAIYNLACPASPVHYQFDPVRTLQTCAAGTFNLLERARRDGARLFHASTSEVYGDPEVHPQTESYAGNVNIVGPRSCYDEGKRFAETLVTDYGRHFGVTVKIVRIFNTYGPNMREDDGRVVSNFIVQALRGDDITLFGDGSQTRSFCYVDDLIAGFLRLMASGDEIDGPVNLGNPNEVTVQALATIIVDMVGSRSQIVHRPLPVDDPRRRRPDIGRAQAQLQWAPMVELEAGLTRTIAYFRDQVRHEANGPVPGSRAAESRHAAVSVGLQA